ncbi:MAG: flippase [Opitutales bacterium]
MKQLFVSIYQRFARHRGFRKYLKNTSWILGGQAFRMGIGLVVSIAVARHLGPEDFGRFNFVQAVLALMSPVAMLGLNHVLRRETVEEPDKRDELLGTWYGLTLASSLLLFIGAVAITGLSGLPKEDFDLYLILCATLLVHPLGCINTWFFSQVRAQLSVVSVSGTLLLMAIVRLALIYVDAELRWFALAFLIETLAVTAVRCFFYVRHYASLALWRFSRERAERFLRNSWPLIITGLAVAVNQKVDQLVLGSLIGKSDLGDYASAVRVCLIWTFVPGMLATSLFTAIIHAKQRGEGIYRRRLQYYFDLNAALGMGIALPLSIFSPWIIDLLYGDQFTGAAPVLAVYAWGTVFTFLMVARMQCIVAENRMRFSMISTVLGAFVNLGLNLVLVPQFAGVGAAWASVLSLVFVVFVTTLVWRPTRPIGIQLLQSLFFFLRLHRLKPSGNKP